MAEQHVPACLSADQVETLDAVVRLLLATIEATKREGNSASANAAELVACRNLVRKIGVTNRGDVSAVADWVLARC